MYVMFWLIDLDSFCSFSASTQEQSIQTSILAITFITCSSYTLCSVSCGLIAAVHALADQPTVIILYTCVNVSLWERMCWHVSVNCTYWQILIIICTGVKVFVAVCPWIYVLVCGLLGLLAEAQLYLSKYSRDHSQTRPGSRLAWEPMFWMDLSHYDVKRV